MYITLGARRLIYPAAFALIMALAVITALLFFFYAPDSAVSDAAAAGGAAPTLIIDAGHGGEDGGAVSRGGLTESGVNLDIARRVELLAGLYGITTEMTRSSEEIEYPESAKTVRQRKVFDQKTRVDFIASIENGVLISIHQNNFPDSRPRGPQALFAKTQGSALLAEIAQENLKQSLYPESRRVAAPVPGSIYLMKNVSCPAILVECGFLSNEQDEALLKTGEYRLKLAAVITVSYIQYAAGETGGGEA